MKENQLAISPSLGLLRIEKIVSKTCIYCRILTGDKRGGATTEYETTITYIPGTEELKVY
jgi:hypothetical protein